MATCYRQAEDHAHAHLGPPFYRCRWCKRVICYDCIGLNVASGDVLCVACAQSRQPRVYRTTIPVHPTSDLSGTLRPNSAGPFRKIMQVLVYGTASVFTGVANALLRILRVLGAPFRANGRWPQEQPSLGFDVSFTSFRDKAWFTALLVVTVVVVACAAVVYADINGIARYRVLLTVAASCTFWGITSIYLQYLFDRPLGRPTSRILAYVVAFFVTMIFGSWLIDQHWLDNLLGFLR